ncbi:hypothetical protein [Deinococcus ruber]|uniref:hypothetical protein n=1 Tax=Deinococcus ruber TaxID=1848197 RepID=UPI001662AEA6|nr:hypothetical protein [Deinococcus ruber]
MFSPPGGAAWVGLDQATALSGVAELLGIDGVDLLSRLIGAGPQVQGIQTQPDLPAPRLGAGPLQRI